MVTLYSMRRSGNCYKVRLALAQLGIDYDLREVDILQGETRTPEFLAMNPSGHVPLLQVAPGRFLPESNAILWFLAEGTHLLSNDPVERAATLQWMFFEQHALEPNASAPHGSWLVLVKGGRDLQQHALEDWMEEGYRSLGVMEQHLSKQDFLADGHYSIADIALYAYTHIAHECDFDLSRYPSVRAWLKRVASQANHVAMDWHPTAAIAAARTKSLQSNRRLDVGVLDDLRPFGDVGLDDLARHDLRRVGSPDRARSCAKRSRMSGMSVIRNRRLVRPSSTIAGFGVPAGAIRPNHEVASKPGKPDSATVGRFGITDERFNDVTARPRNWPSRTIGMIEPMFCSVMVTRPPITSVNTAPRYGTWTMSTWARLLSNSPAMCCGVPVPGEA